MFSYTLLKNYLRYNEQIKTVIKLKTCSFCYVITHETFSNFLNYTSNHQNISTSEFTDSSVAKQTERNNLEQVQGSLEAIGIVRQIFVQSCENGGAFL